MTKNKKTGRQTTVNRTKQRWNYHMHQRDNQIQVEKDSHNHGK